MDSDLVLIVSVAVPAAVPVHVLSHQTGPHGRTGWCVKYCRHLPG